MSARAPRIRTSFEEAPTVTHDADVKAACSVLAILLLYGAAGGSTALGAGNPFVIRSGARLLLGGQPFRFGGANIEWLGVAGYGPADPAGPHRPTDFEIDDALATAQQLGATVVRSQTMGDSVGCAVCIEPARGVFNQAGFEATDYALASARAHGIRIIPTIIGDDALDGGGGCVYLRWRGIDVPNCSLVNMQPFWTNKDVLGDVEAHIRSLLNHVNVYTHVAYKNDPTILGWDLLNGGGSPRPWTKTIARFVRGIDPHHLILSGYDNAGIGAVDACVSFVYPHWSLSLAVVKRWMAACTRAHKPYIAYEYGWDATNYATQAALRAFLATLHGMPNLAGDAFWALEAHASGHGLLPIPADTTDPQVARTGESGEWWALYWPGIPTLISTAADMTARAQIIRAHNYAMRGLRVPPLPAPRAPTSPVATASSAGVHVSWQGSVGAATYSVERANAVAGPWQTVCGRCVTDRDDGFTDPNGTHGAWYRVVPFNLAGRRGDASRSVQAL
jgi:mannan endo-1,4-beta-mannosidase